MTFRDIKQKARRALHDRMRVAAYYYAPGAVSPVSCYVRVHTKLNQQLGDLAGTSFNYAETEEVIPTLVFWLSDGVNPAPKSVVMISATEGYRVSHKRPPDGPTVTAEVALLLPSERAGFSYPGA